LPVVSVPFATSCAVAGRRDHLGDLKHLAADEGLIENIAGLFERAIILAERGCPHGRDAMLFGSEFEQSPPIIAIVQVQWYEKQHFYRA